MYVDSCVWLLVLFACLFVCAYVSLMLVYGRVSDRMFVWSWLIVRLLSCSFVCLVCWLVGCMCVCVLGLVVCLVG